MQFSNCIKNDAVLMQFQKESDAVLMQFRNCIKTASKLRHFFRPFFFKKIDFSHKKLQTFRFFPGLLWKMKVRAPPRATYCKKNHVRIGRFLGRLPSKSVSCCIFNLPRAEKRIESLCVKTRQHLIPISCTCSWTCVTCCAGSLAQTVVLVAVLLPFLMF